MGREVRRVPRDWSHPKLDNGEYRPLFDGKAGDYEGVGVDDCMPEWPESQRTHYMMYETCTEGTPISPAFASPEELARWLADTGANAFAGETASYEGWLRVANGGYAPSAILSAAGLRNCVDEL